MIVKEVVPTLLVGGMLAGCFPPNNVNAASSDALQKVQVSSNSSP
ncbi:hypothetical protein ABNB59_19140 [Paenibacillus larvae]|uniref:Lipoprotein n=1 Tax=Paenibacillus larvae TaxID=1464 RepID=A0AAP5JR87_9BACL|nr:hypothetical protein [Paenibacillus larvae]AVF23270.1 hypothetical protein ERICI_03509 [Paenibacillus larvae subsp. larvae]ETK26049.1 hypothetical protein ERIC1_2c02450 [Paenibacillus larvae subsp. larvae DSM 25719]MDE5125045.1 hypothetical protein [Paenibacillus larvae subsp. larvae]MDE5136065.1 hypothetical protein [Paenibacillus larvae subsp. larvae]MDE5139971.1 hypothetical protein [Paenibacillus larvae subsp. larvae]